MLEAISDNNDEMDVHGSGKPSIAELLSTRHRRCQVPIDVAPITIEDEDHNPIQSVRSAEAVEALEYFPSDLSEDTIIPADWKRCELRLMFVALKSHWILMCQYRGGKKFHFKRKILTLIQ